MHTTLRPKRYWLTQQVSLVMCLLFMWPTAVQAEGTHYRFERMWPTLQQPWYFSLPTGVELDQEGNVYVADTENHRIRKFTQDGLLIAEWGTGGEDNGEFRHPTSVAVSDEGKVYVVDSNNHRIQVFTHNGHYISKWGSEGSAPGQFSLPQNIAIAADG